MAQVAHGMNCPYCETFNALGGKKSDEYLVRACACCGKMLRMANPSWNGEESAASPAPSAPAPDAQLYGKDVQTVPGAPESANANG